MVTGGRLRLPLKVGQVAEMNGRFRRRSYVNVYPISDSSEAGGHLMSSAESRPSPHVGSKVQPLPQGSHRILATSWLLEARRRDAACQERYQHPKEKEDRKDGRQVWSWGPVRPAGVPGCLMAPLVRRPGRRSLILKAPQRSGVQPEEELIVLETDEARAQLDCKAAL